MPNNSKKHAEEEKHQEQRETEKGTPVEDELELPNGFFKREIDFTVPPVFNFQENPKESLGVSDLDGMAVRFFVELSHAGHAFFNEESWGKLLNILNFKDFLSGRGKEKADEFKSRCVNYRLMKTDEKPWGSEYSRFIHKHWVENKDSLEKLLAESIKEAKVRRNGAQPREIIFFGDMLSDRDASAGDMPILIGFYVAIKSFLPLKVMASNHDIMAEQIFQFLSACYGEVEEKTQESAFLKFFRQRAIKEKNERKKNALFSALKECLGRSITNNRVTSDNIIKAFKSRQSTYTMDTLKDIFDYLLSIPVDFLNTDARKELLKEMLWFMPVGIPLISKAILRNFHLLKNKSDSPISYLVWRAIESNKDTPDAFKAILIAERHENGEFSPDIEGFIAQSIQDNPQAPDQTKELFSSDLLAHKEDLRISSSLNFLVCEHIRKSLCRVEPKKYHRELNSLLKKDRDGDVTKGVGSLKKDRSLVAIKVTFSEDLKHYLQGEIHRISMRFKLRSPTMTEDNHALLLGYYKWLTLKEMRCKKADLFRVDQVKRIIARSESLQYLPVQDNDFMEELLSLRNLKEILTDVRSTLDEMINATESMLRQAMVYPKTFWPSSASILMYISPGSVPEDLEMDIDPEKGRAIITLSGKPIYEASKDPDVNIRDFRRSMTRKFQEIQKTADCRMLDDKGDPTEHVKRRFNEVVEWFTVFKQSTLLIYRSGINGDFITHAPLVGLEGETSDQSVVRHYLLPTASIMLDALDENKRNGSSETVKEEAFSLHRHLSEVTHIIPREKDQMFNLPGFHVKLWALIDSINASYRFFLHHSLIVPTESTRIPKTHIGLLSRFPKAKEYESIIIQSGRSRAFPDPNNPHEPVIDIQMGQGFGACSEKDPLLSPMYFGTYMWGRSSVFDRMCYRDSETQQVLCQLVPIYKHSYGHMGKLGGPFGKCIDSSFDPRSSKTTKYYRSITPRPQWVSRYIKGPKVSRALSLSSTSSHSSFSGLDDGFSCSVASSPTSNEWNIPESFSTDSRVLGIAYNHETSFFPLLAKDIVKGMIEEEKEAKRQGRSTVTEGIELRDVDSSKLELGLLANKSDTLSINMLRRQCLADIRKRFVGAGDQSISIYRVIHQYLKGISTHPSLQGSVLAQRANIALNYLDHPDKLTERARKAFQSRCVLKMTRKNRSSILIENWMPFYALGEGLISMIRLEPATFVISPEKYSQDICDRHGIRRFFDEEVTELVEMDASNNKKRTIERSKTTAVQIVFAILALFPASALTLSELFVATTAFLSIEDTEEAGKYFANPYTLIGFGSVALVCFLLVENRHRMPHSTQCFLEGLSRVFPRLSGISRQWIFSFSLRPFVYIEVFNSMLTKMKVILSGEEPICPNPASINNVTLFTTPILSKTSAITPQKEEPSPVVSDGAIPVFSVWTVSYLISIFAATLAIINPKTSMFPGYQSPREIIDKLEEGSRSIHIRRSLSLWGAFGWLESILVIGVGIFVILNLSSATCSNYMAAMIGTTSMSVPLTLRLIAYPPNCRGCSKGGNSNNPGNDPIRTHVTKKRVRKVSLILTAILKDPLSFYLLGVYGSYLYYNYFDNTINPDSFLSNVSECTYQQAIIGLSLIAVVLIDIDEYLSFDGYFARTDDLDTSEAVREMAAKRFFLQRQREGVLSIGESGIRVSLLDQIKKEHQAKEELNL